MVGIIIQMLRYHFEWRKKMEFVELAQPCKTLEVVLTKGLGSQNWSEVHLGVANRVVFHLDSCMAFRLEEERIASFYAFLNEVIFKY